MQYIIWDFDGTLAFRSGMWSGTLIEVLRREMPGHPATISDIRPYMQDGFPWNRPEHPHEPVTTGDKWWEDLLRYFKTLINKERSWKRATRAGWLGTCEPLTWIPLLGAFLTTLFSVCRRCDQAVGVTGSLTAGRADFRFHPKVVRKAS